MLCLSLLFKPGCIGATFEACYSTFRYYARSGKQGLAQDTSPVPHSSAIDCLLSSGYLGSSLGRRRRVLCIQRAHRLVRFARHIQAAVSHNLCSQDNRNDAPHYHLTSLHYPRLGVASRRIAAETFYCSTTAFQRRAPHVLRHSRSSQLRNPSGRALVPAQATDGPDFRCVAPLLSLFGRTHAHA